MWTTMKVGKKKCRHQNPFQSFFLLLASSFERVKNEGISKEEFSTIFTKFSSSL
jgi:hypothetical protein